MDDIDWTALKETHTQTMMINLAAVIPIPIAMLAFSDNPVVGGNKVTATIILKSAALMDIPISISSTNEQVATVTGTVTIPKGEISATFDVDTLVQQAETQVSIQAFYAQRFQSVLTVTPPPS